MGNDPARNSFDKHYMPLVKSKDFNALIDNKPFIYQPGKANNMHMKTLLKYQETMTIQREA